MSFEGPYARTPIQEVIPDSVKLKSLSRSSVITGRRRIRVVPQTGSTYLPAGQTQCNIMLQDSAGLLDLQSCVLSYKLQTSTDGQAAGNMATKIAIPDDFAWSVIQRLQVSLNSLLVDDVDYCGRRATMEVYASASRAWYSSVGSFMGAWKFVEGRPALSVADGTVVPAVGAGSTVTPTLTVAANNAVTGAAAGVVGITAVPVGASIPKNDVESKITWANLWFKNLYRTGAPAWAARSEGVVFAIPLSMLSHFFRMEQYFPLRNAGQLMIQLLFAQPKQCLYNGGSTAAADVPNYKVTDLVMECDVLTCHPEYTALLDGICARGESEGLALSYDSHLVSQQNPGTGSSVTIISSKASQNVRSLHFTCQPSSTLGNTGFFQNSTFNCNDITQFQLRVGSLYYPAFPSQGLARNFMELASSFNSPSPSVGQVSLIDYDSYRGSTTYANNAWTEENPMLYPHASCYIGGYCFDNLKNSEVLSHDGINTLSQSGAQIALDIRIPAGDVGTVTTYIRFSRTLIFADSGVKVNG